MKEILLAWGPQGFLGIAGCYLMFSAIIGKLLPIPFFVTKERQLASEKQRMLLGIFGLVLALPILLSIYLGVFLGFHSPMLQAPEIPHEVEKSINKGNGSRMEELGSYKRLTFSRDQRLLGLKDLQRSNAKAIIFTTTLIAAEEIQPNDCRKVESFGLEQRHIQRLKYESFQKKVFVYVGDIHTFKNTNLYIFTADTGWQDSGYIKESDFLRRYDAISGDKKLLLKVERRGDSVEFDCSGQKYRLIVNGLYKVLLGADKISVEICELRRSSS